MKMRHILGGAAFLLALSASAENLVKNPGFEENTSDWRTWGVNTKLSSEDFRSIVVIDDKDAKSGKRSVVVTDKFEQGNPYMLQFVPLKKAEPMKLSFWAKAPEGQTFRYGAQLGSGTDMKSFKFIRAAGKTAVGTGQWQQCEYMVAGIADGVTIAAIYFGPGTQQIDTGTLRIDDVVLEPLGEEAAAQALGIDRDVEFRKNVPYMPADGATLELNPTPFCWLPVFTWKPGSDVRYSLEYSQDPQFKSKETTRVKGIAIHTEIPRKTLAVGKWFWRYGVEQGDKVVWSKVRSFTVPAGIPDFPFPDKEELTKRIPKTHPRISVTPDQVARLRERAKNGDLKELVERFKCNLQGYIGKELIAEPPFLPPPGDPTRGAVYTMIFTTRRPDMWRMENFGLLYLMTGDKVYGEEAKRRVMHFLGWNPDGSTALTHNDEPARSIMGQAMMAYDWTYDLYTPEERAKLEKVLIRRIQQNYEVLRRRPMDSNPYESHNNSYVIYMATAAMALLPEHPELYEAYEYGVKIFWAHFPIWAEGDGGWNEGPGYWSYYVLTALKFVNDLKIATGVDVGRKPFWQNTGYYPLYGWPARSKQTSFGDGANAESQAVTLRDFAAFLNNPDFLAPVNELRIDRKFQVGNVLPEYDKIGKPNLGKLPPARFFPGVGFVAMRTDMGNFDNDIGLIFQSNPMGAMSHHHNAQNCLMLEAYGEPLAISSGYYDYYSSPHHDKWTRQTKARWGMTFDGGQGQFRGAEAGGKITEFKHGKDFDLAVGDASKAYHELERSIRTIVHVRPGIFVVRDENSAKVPHVYEYNMHGFNPGAVDEAAQKVTIKMPKTFLEVRFFGEKPWKFNAFDQFPAAVENARNAKNPEKLWPNQWHCVASEPEAVKASDLITVLLPGKVGEEGKLPEVKRITGKNAAGVEIRFKDGSRTVVGFASGKAGDMAELGGVSSDKRTFAVKYDAKGKVVAEL